MYIFIKSDESDIGACMLLVRRFILTVPCFAFFVVALDDGIMHQAVQKVINLYI